MHFRPWVLLPLTIAILTSTALAQAPVGPQPPVGGQPPAGGEPSSGPPVVSFSDGGASISGAGPMESIYISPKPNAPFSLKLAAEWSRPLPGGGNFTLANERAIVRDSRGRIYQERWILVPKGGDVKSVMNVFQITDPEQHTWYNCSTRTKVCELLPYRDRADAHYQPRLGTSGPLPDGRGFTQVDDLGIETIQGLETHGHRESITFNPGTMGNDQQMIIMHEFWFSGQLGINLRSMVDNPQTGKQVFTVTELSPSEPDPAYFRIPEGYRVINHLETGDRPNVRPARP
jgi:hypothetical protein